MPDARPFDVLVYDASARRWRPVWAILSTSWESANRQLVNLRADVRRCPRCLVGAETKVVAWKPRKGEG